MAADEIRAVLEAYKRVAEASWPTLHADMAARSAGWAQRSEAELRAEGLDDFDRRLPWVHQAAKYRADDKEVFTTGEAKLDILERQKSSAGITWVHAGKAPIRKADGSIIGVFGMYELLDAETGRRRFAERSLRPR